jgi:predicted MPP superfamily phosphohydrolase
MMVTRRQFLIAATTAAGAVTADAFGIEPNRVPVTHHQLGASDAPGVPLRIVQLSDLHLRELGSHEERIARAVRALAPSLIVITGDSIDHRRRLGVLDDFLGLLDAGTPKLAILGNWEHYCRVPVGALSDVYARRGCRLLVNESVVHRQAGAELLITGLDDLLAGRPSLAHALAEAEPRAQHLVLAHCPMQRDLLDGREPWWRESDSRPSAADVELLAHFRPSYVLSGHTHGGQVAFFGWCPWRPLGSGPYVAGWYGGKGPPLYVSRGLGTIDLPVRFGAPPEVACFDWALGGGVSGSAIMSYT